MFKVTSFMQLLYKLDCNMLMCLLTVKQVGSDATYTGIVIAGIAVTGIVIFDCHVISTVLELRLHTEALHIL